MDNLKITPKAPPPAPEVKPEEVKEVNYTVPAEDTPSGKKGAK